METITLNHNAFELDVAIVDGVGNVMSLQYNRMGQMALTTSVVDYSILLDFTYVENAENQLLGRISPNNRVSIIFSFRILNDTNNYQIALTFIVDYIKMAENSGSTITYNVRGVGMERQKLEKHVSYYTSTGDAIATLIHLMREAKSGLNASEACGERAPSEFMSEEGSGVIDSVGQLLDRASVRGSVYFMSYDMKNGTYKLHNVGRNYLGKKTAQGMKTMASSQSFTDGMVDSFRSVDLAENVSIPLSYNKFYSPLNSIKFNPKTRSWSSTRVSDVGLMNQWLTLDDNYELIVAEQQRQLKGMFNNDNRYTTNEAEEIGRRNRKFATLMDSIEVSVFGDLNLESGGVIVVSTDNIMQEKYAGIWLICSVTHWFENETWVSKMVLSRFMKPKNAVVGDKHV